ncbi:glycoside hydrolase family 27 protein [Mucilaginibacter sp. SP1R1]|uniref:glycoside hydrolase family 27 protein n=1 Tax=Mucilaginibacter sp. SP1R1 TaxID=2723091 RepID=UPI0016169CE3|nr:glycoside hydrolase family 27 protein [Mucilaginibacter sp. SP1R1]MBB6152410.1 hypothetical protein [Mucilaginibacter sp. SP1R1]
MNVLKKIILLLPGIFLWYVTYAQKNTREAPLKSTPLMGWASWNNYRIDINENLIKKQADALVATGLAKAGYKFLNIDDGYFGGRDSSGNIQPHPIRFPHGMKRLADYIHGKGLKAGIYSDAGINTCGSMYDKDTIGSGMGLFGHDRQDITQFLQNWGYDFLKVDWCGGEKMGLDEEMRYTQIGKMIHEIRPDALYNVCRWKFPGKWVCTVANSWRISDDIYNKFESILKIIDLNADLWKYASPGHVNDMDMLQVGRGMSFEEDKTHFSMWCMMASPLLLGNDLTTMSSETKSIVANAEMIAIDQDVLVYQARRVKKSSDDLEVWARPLQSTVSGKIAVALLNRSTKKQIINFDVNALGIDAKKGFTMHDVWRKTTTPITYKAVQNMEVLPHAVVVLTIDGTAIPYNFFQEQ